MEDIHPFELEPNFTGGTYTVFYGLFRGEEALPCRDEAGLDRPRSDRMNSTPATR